MPKKIFGEKTFNPKSFWLEQFFGEKKNLGHEKILAIKKFCHKKEFVIKIFYHKKNFAIKKFVKKIFCHNEIFFHFQ